MCVWERVRVGTAGREHYMGRTGGETACMNETE